MKAAVKEHWRCSQTGLKRDLWAHNRPVAGELLTCQVLSPWKKKKRAKPRTTGITERRAERGMSLILSLRAEGTWGRPASGPAPRGSTTSLGPPTQEHRSVCGGDRPEAPPHFLPALQAASQAFRTDPLEAFSGSIPSPQSLTVPTPAARCPHPLRSTLYAGAMPVLSAVGPSSTLRGTRAL